SEGAYVIAAYEYDGLGRLVVQASDSSAPDNPDGTLDTYTHHFHAGVQLSETRDATVANAQAETLQAHYQYVWSVRYVDAAILRDENTDTDGLCDDGRVYYLTDANFNVTALIDAAGTVVERYVYTPYGEVTIYNADWSATRDASSVDNTHLYTGRDLDGATGLYYYRARWYDAGQGNFLQRDPLGFAAGDANLYRYCGGSPTGSVDPSGLLSDGNHHSGGSYEGVWYSHRDAALRESSWNLFNPMSPGFLPSYMAAGVWHAFSSAPAAITETCTDARTRSAKRYAAAEDTLLNRSLYGMEWGSYYAGEAIAHAGIGLGEVGMAGFAAAGVAPAGTAAVGSLPGWAVTCVNLGGKGLAYTGLAAGTYTQSREIVLDLSEGNLPQPRNLANLAWLGYGWSEMLPRSAAQGSTPKPPGWNENWEYRGASNKGTGKNWWDESGGEWHYHKGGSDPWHADSHWDYDPWVDYNNTGGTIRIPIDD
ncbi:MAG: RHS repeat-associated core domain-containing protein, partial [Patescibacteria group bacterium]|nr:RHS repeat-associated core domain-containing protein [Patescibacteria group bacterium]